MALWTPEYIDTALWLDAADSGTFSLDGNLVDQWADKSGAGLHAAQTGAARPSRVANQLNGLHGVVFADQLFLDGNVGVHNWQDVFVVGQWTAGGSKFTSFNGVFTGRTSAESAIGLIGNIGGDGWYPGWHDTILLNTVNTAVAFPTITAPFFLEFSKNTTISVDGYRIGTDRTNQAREWQGFFGEIVAFDRLLSTEDREFVEGYLAHKWGLAANLPADHPYKSAAPGIASISGTISGIIRDRFGNPCQRKVYAVSRPTDATAPRILAHGLSDPTTGAYELILPTEDEVTRIVVAQDDDPLLYDIADRIIPGSR